MAANANRIIVNLMPLLIGLLSVSITYGQTQRKADPDKLPIATATTPGIIKVPLGSGLALTADGALTLTGSVSGTQSATGLTPTISIGTVTGLPPGSTPTVTKSGSTSAPVFSFGLPAGAPGLNGTNGVSPTFSIGTVNTLAPGATATVSITGTFPNKILNLGIPAGQQGLQGVQGNTGLTGATGSQGIPGANGQSPTFSIGTITNLAPGSTPTVTISGTFPNLLLNIGLVRGEVGASGAAATSGAAPVTATYPSTVAELNAAINALPATGGVVSFTSTIPVTTTSILINNKSNVVLSGVGKRGTILNTAIAVPSIVLVGQSLNCEISDANITGTGVSADQLLTSLIQTYWDSNVAGLKILRNYFKDPRANRNAISLTPYSPTNEGGVGQGTLLKNVTVSGNEADSVGRAFCEATGHSHVDNNDQVWMDGFGFKDNVLRNLGVVHPWFGPGLSLSSGRGQNAEIENNSITNAKFAGIEIVGWRDVTLKNNHFVSTNSNNFSGYAVSMPDNANNKHRARNIKIYGGGGSVSARPMFMFSCNGCGVEGGDWTARNPAELRVQGGYFRAVTVKVTTGSASGGAQCLTVSESNGVEVDDNDLRLTSTNEQNFAIIGISASTSNSFVRRNLVARPLVNQNDSFISNLSATTTVTNDNTLSNTP